MNIDTKIRETLMHYQSNPLAIKLNNIVRFDYDNNQLSLKTL